MPRNLSWWSICGGPIQTSSLSQSTLVSDAKISAKKKCVLHVLRVKAADVMAKSSQWQRSSQSQRGGHSHSGGDWVSSVFHYLFVWLVVLVTVVWTDLGPFSLVFTQQHIHREIHGVPGTEKKKKKKKNPGTRVLIFLPMTSTDNHGVSGEVEEMSGYDSSGEIL